MKKLIIAGIVVLLGLFFMGYFAVNAQAFTPAPLLTRFPAQSSSGGMAIWKQCETGRRSAEWCNLYEQVRILKEIVKLMK